MEVLKPLVDQLVDLIKNGADFLHGQIPDIAQQILRYKLWETLADIPVFAFLVFLAFKANSWCKMRGEKAMERNSYDGDPWIFFSAFIPIVIGIFVFCVSVCDINSVIKITVAPKLYLLDYLKEFLTVSK